MSGEHAPGQIPVFTLEAVNALVPRLNAICGEQLLRRSEIEARLKDLAGAMGGEPESLQTEPGDAPEVKTMKRELAERIEEYQKGWHAVEEMGAVLKDPKLGLVDFYGRVDGKLVWLCWKYGEEECRHYHALDEGFSGRREIKHSMKTRLLN